ncbi:MAG: agmatinase family protein [Cyanobacteria bacterium]|nr:agmatinase family protein [Cyanobacteriota bacterium]
MANREAILNNFDPSGVGLDNGNLYGLPFDYESAQIIIFGVPWEVTVSYQGGTAGGPESVLKASPQLDLYDLDNPKGWQQGIYMPPIPDWIHQRNLDLRPLAQKIIAATEVGQEISNSPNLSKALKAVNSGCTEVNQWLYKQSKHALDQGKRVGAIGGDHSIPLGLMQALAEQYPSFGILHIDAHADLRHAYQGFQFSHASIMDNAMALPQIARLVQVGVRDISHGEIKTISASTGRIITHYDSALKQAGYQGTTWQELCDRIIEPLPQQVYISFDVDGLDPKLCPHTGTPVPGGLELEETFCLLRAIVKSNRNIIGFDVSEVGHHEWDGNVGARIIYKLCNLIGLSQHPSS